MPYATQQDLIDRFGEQELLDLADRDADGVIDQAVVDKALADADQTINSYIGRRYDLPLAAVPAVLARVAADIARHQLYVQDPTEAAEKNYKEAIVFLRDLAKGAAVLDAAGSEPAGAPGGPQSSAPARVFTSETLKDFG